MIDHVSIGVADLKAATAFYEPLMRIIGLNKLADRPETVGFGKRYPEFWLNARPGRAREPDGSGMHVCLRTRTQEQVDRFHAAALAAGAASDGPPGLRPEYHATYYATFIRDPDGNRFEVVTFLTGEDG